MSCLQLAMLQRLSNALQLRFQIQSSYLRFSVLMSRFDMIPYEIERNEYDRSRNGCLMDAMSKGLILCLHRA